jgi:two-component system sensor histidine kinase QseC
MTHANLPLDERGASAPTRGRGARQWRLRSRLLAIIGISLTSVWSLVAVWTLVDVRDELRTVLDERLAASARMVAGLMAQMPAFENSDARTWSSVLDVVAPDGLVCEVSLLNDQAVLQTMAKTKGSPSLAQAPEGFSTRTFGDQAWRSYVLQQGPFRIATADRVDLRRNLLRDVALAAGIPFAVALVGSLLILWFGISRGLSPIERVRAALADRRPDDGAPLPELHAPPELTPLVETIRHLIERMRSTIARERRFTDDAAHELRTPLTAVKTHLQVLRLGMARPDDAQSAALRRAALDDAELGVVRLQGTLEQLLLLARLDGPVESSATSLSAARSAAWHAIESAEGGLRAGAGRVALEILGQDDYVLAVPEPLLVSALRNLLDNALRYSLPESGVRLSVERQDHRSVRFRVVDEGPGMSQADCGQAVQRFWRRGPSSHGSGLGLSIVNEMARRHGGSLHLEPGPSTGLVATLVLPTGGPDMLA